MEKDIKSNLLVEIVGWYGAVAIVLAYVLVSFNAVSAKGAIYQILNLSGAIGIIVVAVRKKARQPAVLNIFWALIALIALIKIAFGK